MTWANFQCKEDFKEKASIINYPNKKFSPNSNCKAYLQKNLSNKFVTCQNGHEWC